MPQVPSSMGPDLDHRQSGLEGKTTLPNLFPALPRTPPPQDQHLLDLRLRLRQAGFT